MKMLDFEGSRTIGAPADWDQELDGPCGSIHVYDQVDVQSGLNQMFTFYRPTPEELVALADGGCIRLGILGMVHPVFNFAVLSPEVAKAGGLRDSWDMGGIVAPD